MRKFLTVLITLLALLAVALPAVAGGNHDKPKRTTTTTTTLPEETTTTVAETNTSIPLIEVCRDNAIIPVPADQVLETDDRIFTDSQRDNCKPPRVPPVVTPEPGPVVQFPPYSVGYACPGTDGVVVELPWGTYEDMWPTPELAKLYGCPVVEEIPVVLIAPTSTVLTELPFTGPSDSLPFLALAGLAALGLGGVMVRSARSDG